MTTHKLVFTQAQWNMIVEAKLFGGTDMTLEDIQKNRNGGCMGVFKFGQFGEVECHLSAVINPQDGLILNAHIGEDIMK